MISRIDILLLGMNYLSKWTNTLLKNIVLGSKINHKNLRIIKL